MEKSGIAGMRMAMFLWKGGAIMIYTLTLNPSLDYLVELESLSQERSIAQTVKNWLSAEKA